MAEVTQELIYEVLKQVQDRVNSFDQSLTK